MNPAPPSLVSFLLAAFLLLALQPAPASAARQRLGPFLVEPSQDWRDVTLPEQKGVTWTLLHEDSVEAPRTAIILQNETLSYSGDDELGSAVNSVRHAFAQDNPQGIRRHEHQIGDIEAVCFAAEKGALTLHFMLLPKAGRVFMLSVLVPGPEGGVPARALSMIESLTLLDEEGKPLRTSPAEKGAAREPATETAAEANVLATPDWALKPPALPPFFQLTKSFWHAAPSVLFSGMSTLAGQEAPGAAALKNYHTYLPPEAEAQAPLLADSLAEAASLVSMQGTALGCAENAWDEAVLAAQYGNENSTREALALVAGAIEDASASGKALDALARRVSALAPLPEAAEAQAQARQAYHSIYASTREELGTPEDTGSPDLMYHEGHYSLVSRTFSENLRRGTPPSRSRPPTHQGPTGHDSVVIDSNPNDSDEEVPPRTWWLTRENNTGNQVTLGITLAYEPSLARWEVPELLRPGVPATVSLAIDPNGAEYLDGRVRLSFGNEYANALDLAAVDASASERRLLRDSFSLRLPRLPTLGSDVVRRYLSKVEPRAGSCVLRLRDPAASGVPLHTRPIVDHELKTSLFLELLNPGMWGENGDIQTRPIKLFLTVQMDNMRCVYTYSWTPGSDQAQADAGTQGQLGRAGSPADRDATAGPTQDNDEALRFHNASIEAITRTIERDEQDLERERDPDRRALLEWRLLQSRSDLVAERDLIASLEQGTLVHTRTPFDDYAHNRFVASIRENQLEMIAFQREKAAIERLIALMPEEQRQSFRNFVAMQVTREVRENMDRKKVRAVALGLSAMVQGHWEGEAARQLEKAEEYNDYAMRAERVRTAADLAIMVGCSGTSSLYRVGMAYATGSGLVTGGPAEAVSQAAAHYSAPLTAAVEALRAYPNGGVWEAGKAGAVGFMMSKMVQLGGSGPGGVGTQLTVREAMGLAEFQRARALGRSIVDDFSKAREALVRARTAGRPIAELRALEKAVAEKAALAQTHLHAKSVLKYEAPLGTRKAFVEQIDQMHYRVEAEFHRMMAADRWGPQQLRAVRNASSAGTVNMDFDIMLVEEPGMRFLRNGRTATLVEWQAAAQEAWEKAFHRITGLNAGHAMEELTTHTHPEAYKDLAWISRDKARVSSLWATQAGDVTRYKGLNIMTTQKIGEVDYYTRLMEAARGTAKDIDTKLLDRLRAGRTNSQASAGRKRELEANWSELGGILRDIGEGRLDPVHGDRMVRRMTGGFGITDVIDHAATLLGEQTKRFSSRP